MNTVTESLGPGIDARATYPSAQRARDGAALIGRVLLGALFVWSGFGKIMGFAGAAGYIASKGLPFPTLLAAIAVAIEFGAGLALLVGWKTRWAAALLAVFLVVITPIFHNFWSVPADQVMMQQINFFKNVAILGGMLFVYAMGPGRYSVDRA
jgi:putative oxidoreductase